MKFVLTIHEDGEGIVSLNEVSIADALDAVKAEILNSGVPLELMPLTVTVCGDYELDVDYGVEL
jgi:hypothetical protein